MKKSKIKEKSKEEKETKKQTEENLPKSKEETKNELAQVGRYYLTSQDMSPKDWALIHILAKENHIPLTGITILGGKPYVNVTGLDAQLKRDKRKLKRVSYIKLKSATVDDPRAGAIGIVEFEDDPERMKLRAQIVLEGVKAGRSMQDITEIVEQSGLSAPIFKDEGWASPHSIKMSTLKNVDCIDMLAIRRATNRAKRQAIGCGLTSTDELPFDWEQYMNTKGNESPIDTIPSADAIKTQEKTVAKTKDNSEKKDKGSGGDLFSNVSDGQVVGEEKEKTTERY